jgi:hypothetical protein
MFTKYSTLTSEVLELNSLSLTRDISRSRILFLREVIWGQCAIGEEECQSCVQIKFFFGYYGANDDG